MRSRIIFVESNYQAKLICRSFLFYALLFITGGITYLQWAMQGNVALSRWDWLMHGQTFSFPMVNAYLYGIVQSFFCIFLTVELFERGKQKGTTESLEVRPAGNSELFCGRVWGTMKVLLGMGIFSGILSVLLNVTSMTPFNGWYYVFYLLTLTFPSLVFFTGFSSWLVWRIRSRVLVLLLLCVYLYASVVWFPRVCYGLLDFTGSTLSNVFSSATGHVEPILYLLHRFFYFALGVGFLLLTISLQYRLPNDRRTIFWGNAWGSVVLGGGVIVGGLFMLDFFREKQVREIYKVVFIRYAEERSCQVAAQDIVFEQQGNRIFVTSDLSLRAVEPLSRILLYLNPGLEVRSAKIGTKTLPFVQDGPVLIIERALTAGDSVCLRLQYEGTPDERVAYLDVDQDVYDDTKRGSNFFHFGRRHAFVNKHALVLIPELLWYPTANAPVNLIAPVLTKRAYTPYRLRVVRPKHPVTLSQGKQIVRGDTIEFLPSSPLEGISLCGGKYEQKEINLHGIQVKWYHFPGNDFITPPLFDVYDKEEFTREVAERFLVDKTGMIQDKRRDFKKYITNRDWYHGDGSQLLLVEVPLPFTAYYRWWKGRGGHVQPGMILLGERGMDMFMFNHRRIIECREKKFKRYINSKCIVFSCIWK